MFPPSNNDRLRKVEDLYSFLLDCDEIALLFFSKWKLQLLRSIGSVCMSGNMLILLRRLYGNAYFNSALGALISALIFENIYGLFGNGF